MKDRYFLRFQHPIATSLIPEKLNDPFGDSTPPICDIVAQELQTYLEKHQKDWIQNFGLTPTKKGRPKGKMFGILVVRNKAGELGYLQTFSGTLKTEFEKHSFVPSIFDDSTDDFYINRGMRELTLIGNQIKELDNQEEISRLKLLRAKKSTLLQKWLFDQYLILNNLGETKTVTSIFADLDKNPPAATGECAAPKLLHHAFAMEYKPLAIAEFWWGISPKSAQRTHKGYYPACENKCRPILNYMLGKI